MNFKLKYGISFLLVVALFGCEKKKENPKTGFTNFWHIYNDLVNSGHDADVTFDTEVHSFSFVLGEDKSVIFFGYQSQPSLSSTDYIIEIIDDTDSSVVYSSGHQFSSTELSYVTPNSPINLQSGVHYTLNRIQTSWGQYISETIGHLVKTEQSDYPMNYDNLTITETNFHDYGSTNSGLKFKALPRIDLVFD